MDISQLARQETKFFPLRNPDTGKPFCDEGKDKIGITFASLSSSHWKNEFKKESDEIHKKFVAMDFSPEVVTAVLKCATVDVHNMTLGKKKFTVKNISELLDNPDYSWFKDECFGILSRGSSFAKKPTED